MYLTKHILIQSAPHPHIKKGNTQEFKKVKQVKLFSSTVKSWKQFKSFANNIFAIIWMVTNKNHFKNPLPT